MTGRRSKPGRPALRTCHSHLEIRRRTASIGRKRSGSCLPGSMPSLFSVKCDMEPFLSKVVRWEILRKGCNAGRKKGCAGSVPIDCWDEDSAVVACGEVYRNLKNRSIPPDFLSSFQVSLPESERITGLTAKSGRPRYRAERQNLQLSGKKMRFFFPIPATPAVRRGLLPPGWTHPASTSARSKPRG